MHFLTLPHKHIFLHFLIEKTPKNRYTRKQPTHFSITPLRPKLKRKIYVDLKILKFSMPKKMAPKSQAKIKPSFPPYLFLTISNPKKVSCEQIYNFKC